MNRAWYIPVIMLLPAVTLIACGPEETGTAAKGNRFRLVPTTESGVDFVNRLKPSEDWNIIDYLYYYNGAGVSVGDIDNDGLPDLFFTANESSNRLYRNLGDLRFEDITAEAGIMPDGWSTGTTMADVNGDGWLDIYVSQVGRYRGREGRNQLYINNGDGTFSEKADEYGLGFSGLSTQAAFFDYDLDGDLDMYLLNHSVHSVDSYGPATRRQETDELAGDRLFRNDLSDGGRFTDVTGSAGIYSSQLGYGLGLAITDYNSDGWPDIYVSNDFHENDYLYHNLGDGTFREVGEEVLGHTSRYSMGNETGDVNNDGLIDILSLDMLPGDPYVLRKSAAEDRIEVSEIKSKYGYGPQYVRNALQINSGSGYFSDLGPMSGVYATDWSWGALILDMDNDGWQDIYVTNGIVRRPNDLDYIQYLAAIERKKEDPTDREMTENMPVLKISNYAWRNGRDLQFADSTASYGLAIPSFSNGAAYSDLDLDGDLDLVVNNINEPAFVWENKSNAGNYLQLMLRDSSANAYGLGARVTVYAAGKMMVREMQVTRGFLSSVEPVVHFGLGEAALADSILIEWPGRRVQTLYEVPAGQRITVQSSGKPGSTLPPSVTPKAFSNPIQEVSWKHEENDYRDYMREPLIPYELSMAGPAVATGDIDGDGRDDIYLGGAHGQSGSLFIQRGKGFEKLTPPVFLSDRQHEDVDAALVDADGDGDLDLYVVSGGNQFPEGHELLRDRLYLNDNGTFSETNRRYTGEALNGGIVVFSDVNGDGFPDAFVGTRSVPGVYGEFARSILLINDGEGWFRKDESFRLEGMITAATWLDTDGDGDDDLAVAGDWMPVTLLENDNGVFANRREVAGTSGWWRSLAAADLDGDGREELIAGNLGHNTRLQASTDQPVELFLGDLDGNGQSDPIVFYWLNGVKIPLASKDELDRQVPSFRKQFTTYEDYAMASDLQDIFRQMNSEQGVERRAETFSSLIIDIQPDDSFELRPLPGEVQWSVIQDIFVSKRTANGTHTIILGGNSYAMNIGLGRLDAMPGVVLEVPEQGEPRVVSNFLREGITGDIRALRPLRIGNVFHLVIVRNDEEVLIKKMNQLNQ